MAIQTLVGIHHKGEERNRVACAKELLDCGYGRPIQAVDMLLMGKKLSELRTQELIELNSRLVSSGRAVFRLRIGR